MCKEQQQTQAQSLAQHALDTAWNDGYESAEHAAEDSREPRDEAKIRKERNSPTVDPYADGYTDGYSDGYRDRHSQIPYGKGRGHGMLEAHAGIESKDVSLTFGYVTDCFTLGNDRARRFQRKGWNGKGMYIALQSVDQGSRNTLPYIWMFTADGERVPWLATQTDMLAVDWYEYTDGS